MWAGWRPEAIRAGTMISVYIPANFQDQAIVPAATGAKRAIEYRQIDPAKEAKNGKTGNNHAHSLGKNMPGRNIENRLSGGAKGDRTPDLLHAMQTLSQLSYGPIHFRAGKMRNAAGEDKGDI